MRNKTKNTLALLAALILTASTVKAADIPALMAAIEKVESNGNPRAIGDHGRAYGILQFHTIQVAAGNKIAKTNYSKKEMFEPEKARVLAKAILEYNCKQIKKATGKEPSNEVLSRTWNGGPTRWKPQTGILETRLRRYQSKVSAAMSQNLIASTQKTKGVALFDLKPYGAK